MLYLNWLLGISMSNNPPKELTFWIDQVFALHNLCSGPAAWVSSDGRFYSVPHSGIIDFKATLG